MKIRKYAAIDIGSNAVRLLISTITEPENKEPTFKKTSLVRVPIRLGADVFVNGEISPENMLRMEDTMRAFDLLMKSHKIERYKACATSAMRDASNGKLLAEKVKKDTGIEIEIIDGEHEAAIIAATDLHELIQDDKTYLYVDVGGGSTEVTLFSEGKTIASKSFKLGTVRLLNDIVDEKMWTDVEEWIKRETKKYTKISLIGSGGNINNIFKSSGKKIGKPLSFFYLSSYYQLLNSLTYEERISELNLNEDRADVIIPAAKIYLSAMKWSRARKVYVPKIGLADGIIKSLYNEAKAEENK
ncbi:exopolyphosphatase/guanosine-5'-triphosphate,3'-diphosphate pyrophosphatase [Mesonia maritima]|uniref:Exopolyphosphatase/guanosine-5'-triphosphate, 3'-diphosphate pyrophosphatase n=1 Tax=Mesonia maritima TaxID=1793873 RepID=A0ABU1K8C6_9FLAO|nr:exopolyphosphatase/guanosine-5'-triphosphate,3'-diphosphate pyrophosphatase [Mesonia maritima]